MKEITFLGHDNASLSRLVDLCYSNYKDNFRADIVSIVKKICLTEKEVPFKIENIDIKEFFHENWMINPLSEIILGTMVSKIKKTVFNFFYENYGLDNNSYSTLVHSSSILAKTASYQKGTTIGPGSILAPFALLGNHVSVNRDVTIGHHTKISDFVTLNPSCNIAGYCCINSGVTIGMGTNIIDGKTIGKNSFIGAGSLVTKDIPDDVVAYGVPAKVIRENKK